MFIVPCILLAAIGLCELFRAVVARAPRLISYAEVSLFVLFSFLLAAIFHDAVTNGPLSTRDYGLYGVQYGAEPISDTVKKLLDSNPGKRVLVSSTWGNSPDTILAYYFRANPKVGIGQLSDYARSMMPEIQNVVFVATRFEYEDALKSGKFRSPQVHSTISYPDGSIGFYAVSMAYVDNFSEIIALEREARRKLLEATFDSVFGPVKIKYSGVDMGEIAYAFDANLDTLIRGLEANPFIVEFSFPRPVANVEVSVDIGSAHAELHASAHDLSGAWKSKFRKTHSTSDSSRIVSGVLDGATNGVRLEIAYPDAPSEFAHVHIFEITLRTSEGLLKLTLPHRP